MPSSDASIPEHDFVIIGSGFGGSVSALRLVEKGYDVLMLERGRELKAADFPKTNWDLRRWMWMPKLGFRGLFVMKFFRHVTVLAGAGVGGGSLVYANTLPTPTSSFFANPAWAHLGENPFGFKAVCASSWLEAQGRTFQVDLPHRAVDDAEIQLKHFFERG